MQKQLVKAWYSKQAWVWCLAPLTLLFWCLSACRRFLFKTGVKASYRSKLPVVIIGNIGVGGNGKTPLVIALSEALIKQGYSVAILSRGYGAQQTEFPYLLDVNDCASLVGDEPLLIKKRLACDVVIDPNRARGARFIEQHTCANVILCDDGMQHYALQRDVELCVIDHRKLGNGFLLPMGPLREGRWRLSSVTAIVNNLGVKADSQQSAYIQNDEAEDNLAYIKEDGLTQTYMRLFQHQWVNVKTAETMSNKAFANYLQASADSSLHTAAMAGIGEPKRFFDTLYSLGVRIQQHIAFADHHQFTVDDIPTNKLVLMTEKDAVKCVEIAHENCWYLQISANISDKLNHLVVQAIEKSRQ